MRTCAVVNPVAGGGRVRRLWPQLLARLLDATSSLSVRWTTGPETATRLTRSALKAGAERIVAVGGDGTLHEVVNGFFEEQTPLNASAVLVFVACGSGSDFRRSLGAPRGVEAAQQLRSDRIQPLDLLRIEYTTEHGDVARRYAANIASFGLSGTVVRNFPRTSSPVPPRLRYLGAALRALVQNRPAPVQLTLDEEPLAPIPLRLVAVANGHSFAAGLPIAPTATPFDGQFDVTVLRDVPALRLLRHLPRFYRGTHTALDGVQTDRGHVLRAVPLDDHRPVWVEADGEELGRLPATITMIPRALRLQY